jgi:phosphotransferase system HPr (HPr) family protein
MQAYSEIVVVPNPEGLHLRVASLAAQVANRFGADVTVSMGKVRVSARSPLELLSLGARRGTRLTVTGEGADAGAAVSAIVAFFHTLSGPNGHLPKGLAVGSAG